MGTFGISIALLLLFGLYKSRKAIHMLQQNYYDESHRYVSWMTKNPGKVFKSIDIVFLVFIPLGLLKLSDDIVITIFTIMYLVVFYLYRKSIHKEQVKKALVVTKRVKRLFVTEVIIYFLMIIPILVYYADGLAWLYYLIIGTVTYLSYFLVYIVNVINKPVEKLVFLHYKRLAKKRLASMNIPVIGITGSYGKTSSKNIIGDILGVKYNVFKTPQNFNTPYGMINAINNYLDKFNDLFIAEMGAFKKGEIKELCDLVHPTHGVLTIIGEAHLESFGSRKNIQTGKFELIESLPKDGIAILNGDDKYQTSYELKNDKCRPLWIGIDNTDVDCYATNIKLSDRGTTFDVKFKDDDKLYPFRTKLLGKHNIYNILGGILLGKELGMNMKELQHGVSLIQPIEHRLELKRTGKIYIIDDAYNSNPVGSKRALEVLNMMPGKKIVVTPGMIELGDKQYELNKKFGEYIAKVCDYVILVGEEQTKPIYDGLMEKEYDKDKIAVINNVVDAFDIVNNLDEGSTYVLLENDLPDLFNE